MINYSEKYVFDGRFLDCLSFNPEEFALSILNSNKNEVNKIIHDEELIKQNYFKNDADKLSVENHLMYLTQRYKGLSYYENNKSVIDENISINRIKDDLKKSKENYFTCVDQNCFQINEKKLSITKFNYYEACDCVKICFLDNYNH